MHTRYLPLLAVCAAAALSAPGSAWAAAAGSYKGALYSEQGAAVKSSSVTFRVTGNRLRAFRVRGGVSTCVFVNISGGLFVNYYPLSFSVPWATISANGIARTYVVRDEGKVLATNTLKGRFAGRRASGTLKQQGPRTCSASYRWRAGLLG